MSGFGLLLCVCTTLGCLAATDVLGIKLHTSHHTGMVLDPTPNEISQIILRCTDTVLIYGLELGIHTSDSGYQYRIPGNSITVGHDDVHNPSYLFEYGVSLDLMRWETPQRGLAAHSYPIALAGHAPITIPISISGTPADTSAALSLQVTYVADSDAQCDVHGGLKGPQPIGVIIPGMGPLAAVSADIEKTILRAIDDFNVHLKSAGKSWSLEPYVVYDDDKPSTSRQAAAVLQQKGITAVLGPVTDTGLEGVRIYDGKMVFVSCCSSDSSLAISDHTFRLGSPTSDPARALASLVTHDKIGHALLVRDTDSTHADRLVSYLADAVSTTTIWYGSENADEAAREINRVVSGMPDDTAIVITGGLDALDILGASGAYPQLHDDIPWYAIGELTRALSIASNRPEPFVDLTGIRVGPDPGQSGDRVYDALRIELGLSNPYEAGLHLYGSYDSVWLLGNTIDVSQSLQPDVLASAMPAIAPAHMTSSGILGLDHNGDAIVVQYGIWRMFADDWVRVGTINVLDDSVRYEPWYNTR